MKCQKAPWCSKHVKKEDPRCKRAPTQSINDIIESPLAAKKLCQKKNSTPTAVSSMGVVNWKSDRIEKHLEEFDEIADKEKRQGIRLGNLFKNDLYSIQEMKSTPAKAAK